MNTSLIFRVIVIAIMLVLIPLVLALFFQKIDTELDIKLRKKDIIIFCIVGIVASILLSIQYKGFELFNVAFVMAYLIFMSYTDQKTQLLYNICSVIQFIYQIAILIIYRHGIGNYELFIFIVPAIFFIVSLLGGIGMGDVLIYFVLAVFSLNFKSTPIFFLIYIILFANVVFIITSIIYKIITKDKKKHLPLTIYIAISYFVCNVFIIM